MCMTDKSDLWRLLDDELESLAGPMRKFEKEARDFWEHPADPQVT